MVFDHRPLSKTVLQYQVAWCFSISGHVLKSSNVCEKLRRWNKGLVIQEQIVRSQNAHDIFGFATAGRSIKHHISISTQLYWQAHLFFHILHPCQDSLFLFYVLEQHLAGSTFEDSWLNQSLDKTIADKNIRILFLPYPVQNLQPNLIVVLNLA